MIFSAAITIAGIIVLSIFKLNAGIDFASGTRVDIQSDHKLSTEQVEQDFKKLDLETDSVVLSGQKKIKQQLDLSVFRIKKKSLK